MEEVPTLCIGRKDGQVVHVRCPDGTEFSIMVGKKTKGETRLIFKAPKSVRIWRDNAVERK